MLLWQHDIRDIEKLGERQKKMMQYTNIHRVERGMLLLKSSKNLEEKKAKTCSYDHRWIIKHKKTEVLHCHHISTKQQRSEDAMDLADIMWRQCF